MASKGRSLKLKAHPLRRHPAAIRRAADGDCPVEAWDFLCPCGLEATWNGGSAAEDIVVRLDGGSADPPFVQSIDGGGVLTFHTGYQVEVEGDRALWLRGPINHPKDGVSPRERVVEASALACTVTLEWQITRPDQAVRFDEGEPFCTLALHRREQAGEPELVLVAPDDDLAEYEKLFAELGKDDEEQGGDETPSPAPERRWAAELEDPPPVSAICLTYGRPALLEEAIQSFLIQDYPGQKELIVLNDHDRQMLVFDHPEVRVINLPRRAHSLGEKYKMAVALCTHDLVFVWHDDDIYLPHRLSLSVARFDENKGFFKGDRAWLWNDGQITGLEGNRFHGGSAFSRALFSAVQGYPHTGRTCDRDFEELCLEARSRCIDPAELRPEDVYYLYRWSGTESYHVSSMGEGDHEKAAAYVREQAERGEIPLGEIRLLPRWKADYPALVESFLKSGRFKGKRDTGEVPFPPPYHVIPPPPPMEEEAAAQLFEGGYPLRISVILPCVNESGMLERTVEQFERTLPPGSEIIVVDNGSTDGCSDFLAAEPRAGVHLVRTPDPLGVSGARNRGLSQAQGEVVVFSDAHIDLPERWWQPLVATLRRPGVGVVGPGIGVMGRPDLPAACGQRIAEPSLRTEWQRLRQREPYAVPTLGGGFMAMRHDTLLRAGGFDAGMPQWGSEDLEICVRYWLLGYEAWVVPEVTVLHYFRSQNPIAVEATSLTHNLLRVALLHFNERRLGRVIKALKGQKDFSAALARAAVSGVYHERATLLARRVRDDDWLLDKFADSCLV